MSASPRFTAERMRALRRDSYRCQYRRRSGVACLKPTSSVIYIDPAGPVSMDNLRAHCRGSHEE